MGITQSEQIFHSMLIFSQKTFWTTDQVAALLKELKFFNLGRVASSQELAHKVKDSIGIVRLRAEGKGGKMKSPWQIPSDNGMPPRPGT